MWSVALFYAVGTFMMKYKMKMWYKFVLKFEERILCHQKVVFYELWSMNNHITVDVVVHSKIVDVFYLFLWDVTMDVIDLPFITNEFKCVKYHKTYHYCLSLLPYLGRYHCSFFPVIDISILRFLKAFQKCIEPENFHWIISIFLFLPK